ncbi:MAG: hypothetical protein QM844_15095 [Planctomycetota bacterium]|nr:hypothetical protein [Planctomycetota bacterium]
MDSRVSSPTADRLVSLDALRGVDMFWLTGGTAMRLAVARGAGAPEFLELAKRWTTHAPWEGFQLHDLILPLFFFIVGAAMPLSFGKRLARGDGKGSLYRHVWTRTALLFILGLIGQGHLLAYDLDRLRILYSVLESLALGYAVAAIVYLNTRVLGQAVAVAVFLLGSWAALVWIPVPGHGAGVLTPEGNLVGYVDKLVLGPFYGGDGWGRIVSTPNCACMLLIGALACQWLRSDRGQAVKVAGLLLAGAACVGLGLAWSPWLPIIKSIKTSSFILYATGQSIMLLAVFYLVVDVWGWRAWTFPFVVIGMNSIAVYMAVLVFDWGPGGGLFGQIGAVFVGGLRPWLGAWWPLVHELARYTVIWLILYWMYRARSFVRV